MNTNPRAIVAFDLDGTLLCGPTVCELLATSIPGLSHQPAGDILAIAIEILTSWNFVKNRHSQSHAGM